MSRRYTEQDDIAIVEASERAIRRHHLGRVKKNRSNYWGYPRARDENHKQITMPPRALGAVAQHPQACSCYGCGNPRRHEGERTIQEQRAMQRERYSLDE